MDALACALVGLMCGYALRDSMYPPPVMRLPNWLQELGLSVSAQVAMVEDGHKFAGDGLEVSSRCIYARKSGGQFEVQVKRVKEDAGL